MSDLQAIAGRVQIEALRGEAAEAVMMGGTIRLDGDTASGRAYISELIRFTDGRSELNYAIYHDRYRRTGDGWKFTERIYEVRCPIAARCRARLPGGGCPPTRRQR